MADVDKKSDGPTTRDASAYDFTQLPDWDNDFVNEDDIQAFADALVAPENNPSQDDLLNPQPQPEYITALNDWRPVHQRVRRKKKKRQPRRGKDETREGWTYTILKWPLLGMVTGWLLFLSVSYLLTRFYIYSYEHWVTWRGKRERLRKKLQQATNYEDWVKTAKALDTYLGNDKWREEDENSYYDSKTVLRVRHQLRKLRKRVETEDHTDGLAGSAEEEKSNAAILELRSLLEACVKNNFVGFENPRLYSETYYGTKDLLQSFVDEVQASLRLVLDSNQINQETKRAFFKHLSTNFGRTALCLSGGATLSYYHFGIAKALLDADMLPEVITGTSGGALVASLLATRTNDELKRLLVPALANRITACQDPMSVWVPRWYRTGARFDSLEWGRKCAWFTHGNLTFREAYARTGRILNVSCVPSDPHSPTILANYLTSPDCVIWTAVMASAAVPGILNPVVLMKKNPDETLAPYSFGHKWKDGSLRTDIPLKALNLHFNVRFSIVSQVNPHINLFFFSSRGSVGRPVTHRRGRGWRGGFLGSATEQYLKLDLTKWLKVLRHLELLPRPLGQDWSEVWLQRFSGTITIWAKSTASDFWYILSDPDMSRLARMIHVGQQSAFPKLKFIANRVAIEKVIDAGRRSTRPGLLRAPNSKGDFAKILSEEDLRQLLRRHEDHKDDDANAGMAGPQQTLSAEPSDYSDDDEFEPPTPLNQPPGGLQQLKRTDSPTMSQRVSGWFARLNPSSPTPNARQRVAQIRYDEGAKSSPSAAKGKSLGIPYSRHRPTSMYELGATPDEKTAFLGESSSAAGLGFPFPVGSSGSSASRPSGGWLGYAGSGAGVAGSHRRGSGVMEEIRRQSRVFIDDSDDEVEASADDTDNAADSAAIEDFGEDEKHAADVDEDANQRAFGRDEKKGSVIG